MGVPVVLTEVDEQLEYPALNEIVTALCSVLGDQIVAIVAGAADINVVTRWKTGVEVPDVDVARRLREAWRVVNLLRTREEPDTIRAWFIGMNPELDDQAAALVIADDPDLVINAARYFMANG